MNRPAGLGKGVDQGIYDARPIIGQRLSSKGEAAMSWRDYWEGESAVYVSDRHKSAHYAHLANDIVRIAEQASKPLSSLRVLDFGCGEALSAGQIAARVRHLTLNDGSANVRRQLQARFGDRSNISVAAPEDLAGTADGAYDLIIVNSVLQYIDKPAAGPLLRTLGRTMHADGRMLVADLLPPDLSALTDARELLAFAAREGFLVAAIAGLVRAAMSDYAKIRAKIGLTRYAAGEFENLAASAGLASARMPRNIGHNPHRLAFILQHDRPTA